MNRSTKGALAASAAGALLLGGAGSLAYWSADEPVPGGSFATGYLQLVDNTCASATWKLDDGADYTPARFLVPGDVLTKTCDFAIDGIGDHMTVSLDTATPAWQVNDALTTDLHVEATFVGSVSGALPDPAVVTKDETITATIVVTFDTASGNETNVPTDGLSAVLDAITLTATQGHSAT